VVGTLTWFIASPGLRFGQSAIWTAAGTLGTWGIVSVTSESHRAGLRKMVLAGLLALLVWCLVSFGWKPPYQRLLSASSLEPVPKANVVERTTRSGLKVYVPTDGNQCWDAPLPCAPYFDETLRLRNAQFMRSGFISEAQADILPRFQLRLYEEELPAGRSVAAFVAEQRVAVPFSEPFRRNDARLLLIRHDGDAGVGVVEDGLHVRSR